METEYQKSVNLSYLVAAGIIGYLVFAASGQLVAAYDLETRIRNVDLVIRGVSLFVAAIAFFVLYRNQRVNQFMNEVVTELTRVTWPTPKETANATVVVVVMVLISGLILGFLDYLWTALMKTVL